MKVAVNIIKRTWHQNQMVKIEPLNGFAFQAESGGHTFQISGVDDSGNAVPISGTIAGVFLRPDNTDVALTGSASGGVASVTLKAECYAVPGRFLLTVYATSGSNKGTIYAAMGTVSRTSSGAVSPAAASDVVDLVNRINAATATIPASYTTLLNAVAGDYSDTKTYAVKDFVWYNGHLYRCTTAITTAETWTASHWSQVVLADALNQDITDLKSALNFSTLVTKVATITDASITSTSATRGSLVANDGTNVSVYDIKDINKILVYRPGVAGYSILTAERLYASADLPVTDRNKISALTEWGEVTNSSNHNYLYVKDGEEVWFNIPNLVDNTLEQVADEFDRVKQDEASSYMHENLMKTGSSISATSTTSDATIKMDGGQRTVPGNSYGRFGVTQNKYYRLIGKSNAPDALLAQYSANSLANYIAGSAVARGISETVNVVFKALGTMVFVSFGTYTGQLELHQISKFEFVDQLNTVNREFLDLKYRNIDASMNLIDKSTCIKAYIDANGKIIANNSYYVTDYIPVKENDISAYVTASNNIPPFARYDANFNLLGVDTSNKYTYVSGDAFVRICFTGNYFDTARANYGNTLLAYSDFRLSNEVYAPPTTVFVGSYDWCDYANVQQALYGITDDSASKPYIIHVCPGTYPRFTMKYTAPNVRAESARYISIIGENPDTTIFFDNKGSYMTSPCDIFTNGIVENITFSVITDEEHCTPDTLNVQTSGYAMHTDFGEYRTQFINCIFRCNIGPGVGAGLFEDSLLQFDNCRFESLCDGSFGEHAQTGQGAIFVHTFSESSKAVNQILRINNSIAVAPYQNNGARFAVIGSSHSQYGSEYSFEFQNFGAFGQNGAQISMTDPDSDLLGTNNFNNLPSVLNTATEAT
jgi:hypothetical protein